MPPNPLSSLVQGRGEWCMVWSASVGTLNWGIPFLNHYQLRDCSKCHSKFISIPLWFCFWFFVFPLCCFYRSNFKKCQNTSPSEQNRNTFLRSSFYKIPRSATVSTSVNSVFGTEPDLSVSSQEKACFPALPLHWALSPQEIILTHFPNYGLYQI